MPIPPSVRLYVLLVVALALLLLLQSWLIRRPQGWLGLLLPLAAAGAVLAFALTGRMTLVLDWVFTALGLYALVYWWLGARRQLAEENRDALARRESAFPDDFSHPHSAVTGLRGGRTR